MIPPLAEEVESLIDGAVGTFAGVAEEAAAAALLDAGRAELAASDAVISRNQSAVSAMASIGASDEAATAATTAIDALTTTQTARDQAIAAASNPALAIQPNPATPTVPPSGVANNARYWAASTDRLTLYTNTAGTGVKVSPEVTAPLSGALDALGIRTEGSRLYRAQSGEVVDLIRSFSTPGLDLEFGTSSDGRIFIPGYVPEGAALTTILAAAASAQTAAVSAALANVTPVGAFDAIRSSAYRPIDIVTVGNSKVLFGPTAKEGWHTALARGLAARTGMWATAWYPIMSAQNSLGNQGASETASNNAGNGTNVLPSGYDDFVYPNQSAVYVASGGLSANGKIISIQAASPLNVNSALRYTVAVGGFAAGSGGSVRPAARFGDTPFSLIGQATAPFPTDFGAGQRALVQGLTIPAATRNRPLQFGPYVSGGTADVGPNVYFGHRVEDTAKQNGISNHALLPLPGNSLREIATAFAAIPDARLITYFGTLRTMQMARGWKPRIVVIVQEGMNSRNDQVGSVGPIGGLAGDTGPGYVDNAKAAYNRVRAIWDRKGWDKDELTFLFIIDEFAVENEPKLLAFEASMREWVSSARGMDLLAMNNVITWPEMLAAGFVGQGGDDVHKTPAFYAEAYQSRVPKLIYGEGVR